MTQVTTFPLQHDAVARIVAAQKFDVRRASIRQMSALVDSLEREFGVRFVRMEFGIPGLPAHPIAVAAESDALQVRGVGHVYAPSEGIPPLKDEAARFVERFLGLEVSPACCLPTVGAMEGCFAGLALARHMHAGRKTVICLEPGFPVNKQQLRFLGLERAAFDFYDFRGEALLKAVEERAARGDVCAILWSSPNNPSWIALKESELEGLGRICDRYDLIAIEDLAYLGMDVRQDYLTPGQPPYQPTVLRYTSHGICIISSSKIFSYAGQRIALLVLSPDLFETESPDLEARLGTSNVGRALVHGVLYPIAASVPQAPQHGLLAMLRAANDGDPTVFEPAREYARRARVVKQAFLDNGFRLVYDNDLGEPLADGFYFTISHPSFTHGADLLLELLHYGISAITLETTGSCRVEGLRACVSLIGSDRFDDLHERLRRFREDHPVA